MFKLDLVDEKTEALFITNYRIKQYDSKLSLRGHVGYAREKATKASSSQTRTMSNVGGPK